MTQNITLEARAKRSSVIQNRRFLGILPSGKYKGFYISANGSNLVLGLTKINPATLLDDGSNILLTDEAIRIEETSDIPAVVTLSPGDPTDPRIDIVATKHRYSTANEPAEHVVIPGIPAPTPAAPSIPSDGFQYVVLAQVTVDAAATSIDQGDVNNLSLVAISVTTQPLVSLSDVSPDEADSFQNMNSPSLSNPIATGQDITDALDNLIVNVEDLGQWKTTPNAPADASVNLTGGRVYNPDLDTTSVIVAGAVGPFSAVPSGGDTRTDLIVVDQVAQAFAVRPGVVNGVVGAPGFNDYPVARVFVNELAGLVEVEEADITDVKPLFWRHNPRVSGLFYEDASPVDAGVSDALQASEAASPGAGNAYLTNNDLAVVGASTIGYVPITDADWETPAPAKVQEAFDRIAARVATIEFYPIRNKELFIGETPSSITKDNYYVSAGLECVLVDSVVAPTKRLVVKTLSIITGNVSDTGVNGLDTGSLTTNIWYHIYIIGDTSGTNPLATVFTTNVAGPLLPSGYDVSRRIGSMLTSAALGPGDNVRRASSFDGWTSLWSPVVVAAAGPPVLPGATLGATQHCPPGCRKLRFAVDFATSGAETFYTAIGTISPGTDVGNWQQVVKPLAAVSNIPLKWTQHLNSSGQFQIATASGNVTRFDIHADEYFEEL